VSGIMYEQAIERGSGGDEFNTRYASLLALLRAAGIMVLLPRTTCINYGTFCLYITQYQT